MQVHIIVLTLWLLLLLWPQLEHPLVCDDGEHVAVKVAARDHVTLDVGVEAVVAADASPGIIIIISSSSCSSSLINIIVPELLIYCCLYIVFI